MLNRGLARGLAAIIGLLGTMCFLTAGVIGLPFVILGPMLVILVHELGHAFTAQHLGMAVHAIAVGPFKVNFKPRRLGWSDQILGRDVGGSVVYDETLGRFLSRRTHALIAAAGPAANLVTGAAAYAVGRFIGDWTPGRMLVGFALASLAAFVLSAWPHKLRSGRANDALEIVRDLWPNRTARTRKPKRTPWQAQ